jgi:hypothetical protein
MEKLKIDINDLEELEKKENKIKFLNIAFNHEHKNAFSVFTLVEYRNKYME